MYALSTSPLLLPLGSVNLLEALLANDWVGWLCIIGLVVCSIVGIAVSLQKWFELTRAKLQTKAFQKLVDSDGSWEALFAASKKFPESPTAKLLKDVYVQCRLENWFRGKNNYSIENRLDIAKHTVEGSMLRTIAEEETRLQDKLTWLATISSVAPFIGLFGTVWGVLAAFQAVGREGSAALTALAPGISTALMTTIFGLLAAIPALFFFNWFSREINVLFNGMESFSHDIENAVRKQVLMDEEKNP